MKLSLWMLLLLTVFYCSCSSKRKGEQKTGLASHFMSITDNEDKGIKEVIAFYGGHCEYGVAKRTGNRIDGIETTFFLKLSKCPILDSFASISELIASNMAYMFYKNLGEEKAHYQNIRSELIFSNGKTLKFEYKLSDLKKVQARMPLVVEFTGLIEARDFNKLKDYMTVDIGVADFNVDTFIVDLKQTELRFNPAKSFKLSGFRFEKTDDGRDILSISGILIRNPQNTQFKAYLDPNSDKKEIFLVNYTL